MIVTEESGEKERSETISFPKLNRLYMRNLVKLTKLWYGYYMKFLSLKKFTIGSCPELEIFIFDDKVRVPSLEEMSIFNMDNLNMIWYNQLNRDSFCKLKSLDDYTCHRLLTVFPSNILERLLSLESLNVFHYGSLEEIFDLQRIIFEEGNSIAATQSRELLKCLFATSIVAKEEVLAKERPARFRFPKLTSLKLNKLPELRNFYPSNHTVEGLVLKKAFPCLENLRSAGKNLMLMWQGQVLECLFYKLKIPQVKNDKLAATPTKPKTLVLRRLGNLKYMWKHDTKLDLILQNLEKLIVMDCEISDCYSLEKVVTSTMVKSLVKLTKMDVTEDKIIFISLKSLSLERLLRLISFCYWNFTLEFPSLEELNVPRCLYMKIFSQGEMTIQRLITLTHPYNSSMKKLYTLIF
ncbi:hypothetical protein ACOSQ4_014808 [Xanthoceras sorbifolium]